MSICGQPLCGLWIHPANLNIWMMTQEARSTLFNQSFPICHSDKVSYVPEDQLKPNTRKLAHLFSNKLVFFSLYMTFTGNQWVILHANIWFTIKYCFSCKTTKNKTLQTTHKSSITLEKEAQNENTRKTRPKVDVHRFWHMLDSIWWHRACSNIRSRQLATFKVEWVCIWSDWGWQPRRGGID